jgi:hypothetical protein
VRLCLEGVAKRPRSAEADSFLTWAVTAPTIGGVAPSAEAVMHIVNKFCHLQTVLPRTAAYAVAVDFQAMEPAKQKVRGAARDEELHKPVMTWNHD